MENRFMNGCKKLLFAAVIMISLLSVAPINVNAAKKVKMDQKKVTCTAKERFTLKVKGTSKKVTWTSSNKSIAAVTKNGGNVVTKKAGTATITATVNGKKVKCKVTVKKSAPKPFLTTTSKTLRVGESFMLIEGWYTDYESTFSFNDYIATINASGCVTATGVGTVKVLVKPGQDSKGNALDYYCTINVVAGSAPACKHQWMDAAKFNKNGDYAGYALICKTSRVEAYTECDICYEKFFGTDKFEEHADAVHNGMAGSTRFEGRTVHNRCKFIEGVYYCRNCGLERD